MAESAFDPVPEESRLKERRGFLRWFVGILAFFMGALLALPMLASLLSPVFVKLKSHFSRVRKVDAIPAGNPVLLRFPCRDVEAYLTKIETHEVWAVKHSDSKFTVFSPICPHLGCHYNWYPKSRHFVCPCHGSVFTATGKVVAGPALRPLDTLPFKVVGGKLEVMWEQFQPGIPEKKRV